MSFDCSRTESTSTGPVPGLSSHWAVNDRPNHTMVVSEGRSHRNRITIPLAARVGVGSSAVSRVAAIDIGSRNVKLVVGELDGAALFTQFAVKSKLQLGENVAAHGELDIDKLRELQAVLVDYQLKCAELGATLVGAIGTSAIRKAANRDRVITEVNKLGIPLEIVDGDREAALGYLAATGGAGNALVSELGSRSCGVAWPMSAGIDSRSAELGHVAAYERFFRDASDWSTAEAGYRLELERSLGDLPRRTDQYIALGAKTVAAFVLGCEKEEAIGTLVSVEQLRATIEAISALSGDDFQTLIARTPRGIKIAPALVFLDFVMERAGHGDVLIQDSELPVGCLVEHLCNAMAGW